MKKDELVIVKWVDAAMAHTWMDRSDPSLLRGEDIETVGFVLHDTKDVLSIASTMHRAADRVNGVSVIPKGWIKSKRKLRG